jgi:regulator of replication initiation timing
MQGLREKVIENDKLIGRLRAEISGLQADMHDQQAEIVKLRLENTDLRFSWIAAVEDRGLDGGH